MDYVRLTRAHIIRQIERVADVRRKIVERGDAVAAGRVIPEDGDLAIGTGRRLKAAVLFLDLCGFSARPAETQLEQEMLLRAFNLFFTEVIRTAEEYGGTVEKNTGDGLMVYFEDGAGDPPAPACKRAVACALTMFHATARLINPVIAASNMDAFTFRVGIDYGQITVARLGAPGRFASLVAIGTTANLACKLLNEGGPGDLIVGESVYQQLPAVWQANWCSLHKILTGWTYRATGLSYSFYRYTGRWVAPT